MKLSKVHFSNYRSISGDNLEIEDEITCLVGINEAGKSNILSALEKVDKEKNIQIEEYSRHTSDYIDEDSSPEIILWLKPEESELSGLKSVLGVGEIDYIKLVKNASGYRLDYPTPDYKSSKYYPEVTPADPFKDAEELKALEDATRKDSIEDIVSNYLPRFLKFDSVNFDEYFLPKNGEVLISELIANPNQYKPVKNLLYLGGISDPSKLVAENSNQRIRRDKLLATASKKINTEILRVIWPIDTVEIVLNAEGDLLKIQIKEKDQTSPFKPDERSRGMQWTLAFNIYFLAESKATIKNSVLLIDEPGIFLHINAQNKLLTETFSEIYKSGNQIIYTTHLPYLINPDYPERIRIIEKDKEDTNIGNKAWSEGEFGKIPEPVTTALGLNWTEMFHFQQKNYIVEGPSDQIIFRTLQDLFGTSEIHYTPAYGYEKVPAILAVAKIESKECFAIVDSDKDIQTIRDKCKVVAIPEDSVQTLSEVTQDSSVLTIEDIIPQEVFLNSVVTVYEPIFKKRKLSFSKDEIPLTAPRVPTVEAYFATKFKAKKHKLLKMEVARSIVAQLKAMKEIPKTLDFNSCVKLIEFIQSKFQNK